MRLIVIMIFISALGVSAHIGSERLINYSSISADCLNQISSKDMINKQCTLELKKSIKESNASKQKISNVLSSFFFVLLITSVGGILGGVVSHHNRQAIRKKNGDVTMDIAFHQNNRGWLEKAIRNIFFMDVKDKNIIVTGLCSALIGVPFLASFIGISYEQLLIFSIEKPEEYLEGIIMILGVAGLSGFLGAKLLESLAENLLSNQVKEVKQQQDNISIEMKAIIGHQYYNRGCNVLKEADQLQPTETRRAATKYTDSKKLFLKSIKFSVFNDELASGYCQLAYTSKRLQEFDEALTYIEEALKIEPKDILYHYNKLCYLTLLSYSFDDINKQIKSFSRAMKSTKDLSLKQNLIEQIVQDMQDGDFSEHSCKNEIKSLFEKYIDGVKELREGTP